MFADLLHLIEIAPSLFQRTYAGSVTGVLITVRVSFTLRLESHTTIPAIAESIVPIVISVLQS